MIQHGTLSLTREQILEQPVETTVEHIYTALPSNSTADLTMKHDVDYLLAYYSELYSRVSYLFSMMMVGYVARDTGKQTILKRVLEQALKAIKFEYEGLSRRLTADKDETAIWRKQT